MKYKEVTVRTAGDAAEVAQAILDGKNVELDCGGVWHLSDRSVALCCTYRWQIDEQKADQVFEVGDNVMHFNMHAKIVSYRSNHPKCVIIEYDDGKQENVLKSSIRFANLRPWMPDEVPAGLYLRSKDDNNSGDIYIQTSKVWCTPINYTKEGVCTNTNYMTYQDLKDFWVWSDRPFGEEGPCGVWM